MPDSDGARVLLCDVSDAFRSFSDEAQFFGCEFSDADVTPQFFWAGTKDFPLGYSFFELVVSRKVSDFSPTECVGTELNFDVVSLSPKIGYTIASFRLSPLNVLQELIRYGTTSSSSDVVWSVEVPTVSSSDVW